jgi:hypothetical protein
MPRALLAVSTLMAVSALSRTRAGVPLQAATLSPAVLLLALVAPGIDLLTMAQTSLNAPLLGVLSTSVASAVLLVIWVRWARTSWLAAAVLASCASLAMRLAGADVAQVFSLLAVVALGIGGAFASPGREAEAWLR